MSGRIFGKYLQNSLEEQEAEAKAQLVNTDGNVTSETPEIIEGEKASNFSSTIVISAFPLTGKSTACSKHEDWKDLESSLYSRKQDNSRNEEFPGNYINMLKYHLVNNNWKYIFVASHKVVRDALRDDNIKFYVLYPTPDRKEELLGLARERGNHEEFIKKLDENWETWINNLSQEPNSYALGPGEFISDELFDGKLKFLKQ